MRRLGAHCLVVAMKRGNARGAKGVGHQRWIGSTGVGSTGSGRNLIINGRRQPSHGGTSRMMREYHVRICEGLGVQLPGSTRHSRQIRRTPMNALCPLSSVCVAQPKECVRPVPHQRRDVIDVVPDIRGETLKEVFRLNQRPTGHWPGLWAGYPWLGAWTPGWAMGGTGPGCRGSGLRPGKPTKPRQASTTTGQARTGRNGRQAGGQGSPAHGWRAAGKPASGPDHRRPAEC
jgi:hypothetical protein